MDKDQLYSYLNENAPLIYDVSDKIWDYAETAFEEFQSAALLKKVLTEQGFTVQDKLADIETAFSASFGEGGPVIGILAEYDALSGMSQKAFTAMRSELVHGGNGHGCGHNMFAAGSLGAALAVKEYLTTTGQSGTVRFYGCPAEEGGSGKAFMARAGAFDDLDVAFAWHPMDVNAVFDVSLLANYQVLYKFKGVASHAAAAPELGRSALDAVELMNVGVNFLREHMIQDARIHYAITNTGGFSPNVVQPEAEVLYLIRAPRTSQVEELYQRVNNIGKGAALMTDTHMEIEFVKACANIVPNKTLSQVLYDNLAALEPAEFSEQELAFAQEISETLPKKGFPVEILAQIPPQHRKELVQKMAGKNLCDIVAPFYRDTPVSVLPSSSDVGDVSWNVPTAQIVTACYAVGTPAHSWQLVAQGKSDIAHRGLMNAAKAMAGASIDVLQNPDIIQQAGAEFKERLGGESYYCAIPDDVKPRAISKL